MSRRPATCFRTLLTVSLSAIALVGCGGGKNETPPPQTVAAVEPAAEKPTAPAPTPASAAPVPTTPVAATTTPPAAEPPATTDTAPSTPAPEKSPKPPQPQQPDTLQWMKDSEARRADYDRRLDEAKVNVESADLSMATWERNVLAFKNPFLARPQLSPEDTQAIAGMNGADRVRWAEGRLSEVSAKRAAAQKALDDLKANPPTN